MSGPIGGMSKLAPTEQHVDNAWQTPDWLVERIHAVLGGIELDPCTMPDNPTRAERIYTAADDGILQPWNASRIYVNPPYGKTIRHWVEKCLTAAHEGRTVVLLVPSRTDSRWFQAAWAEATDVLLLRGRLSFKGASSTAPFPNAIFGFNISLEPLADLGVRSAAA